jgi:hypothetical protein
VCIDTTSLHALPVAHPTFWVAFVLELIPRLLAHILPLGDFEGVHVVIPGGCDAAGSGLLEGAFFFAIIYATGSKCEVELLCFQRPDFLGTTVLDGGSTVISLGKELHTPSSRDLEGRHVIGTELFSRNIWQAHPRGDAVTLVVGTGVEGGTSIKPGLLDGEAIEVSELLLVTLGHFLLQRSDGCLAILPLA